MRKMSPAKMRAKLAKLEVLFTEYCSKIATAPYYKDLAEEVLFERARISDSWYTWIEEVMELRKKYSPVPHKTLEQKMVEQLMQLDECRFPQ